MKYKTFAKRTLKTYKNIFAHQTVADKDGNEIAVMHIPNRLIYPIVREFLTCNPQGDIGSWFGYVLYICVPDATELSELYEAEYGGEACSEWIGDMYDKILLVNPVLDYELVGAFQEPVQHEKIVHVNFGSRKKAKAHLW